MWLKNFVKRILYQEKADSETFIKYLRGGGCEDRRKGILLFSNKYDSGHDKTLVNKYW